MSTSKKVSWKSMGAERPNPYAQVALTYLRRPFSSWLSGLASAAILGSVPLLWAIGLSGSRHDIASAPIQAPLLITLGLFAMFIIHVINQFADSRARLMPGFRRVHAAVATAAAVLLAVIVPLTATWLAGLHSIGLMAVVLLLFGVVLCAMVWRSRALMWLISLVLFASLVAPTRLLLWQLLSGQLEFQAMILMALGAAMTVFGGIRVFSLNEDQPTYRSLSRFTQIWNRMPSGQTQPGAGMLPLSLWQRIEEHKMARWTNHVRRASVSGWSRVCRWQVGMLAGWSALLLPIVFFFFSTITVWMTGADLQEAGAVFPLVMFSMMLPGMFWASIGRGRIPMLRRELLLPVERPSYVRQFGMAVALSQLQLLAGMSIGAAIWFFLTARQSFSFTNLALVLGIFTLLQPWFFGVGVWFLRYRTLGMQIGGIMGALYVALIPAALYAAPGPFNPWRYMALPLAAVLGLLGLLLSYGAYRRWLQADFD